MRSNEEHRAAEDGKHNADSSLVAHHTSCSACYSTALYIWTGIIAHFSGILAHFTSISAHIIQKFQILCF